MRISPAGEGLPPGDAGVSLYARQLRIFPKTGPIPFPLPPHATSALDIFPPPPFTSRFPASSSRHNCSAESLVTESTPFSLSSRPISKSSLTWFPLLRAGIRLLPVHALAPLASRCDLVEPWTRLTPAFGGLHDHSPFFSSHPAASWYQQKSLLSLPPL